MAGNGGRNPTLQPLEHSETWGKVCDCLTFAIFVWGKIGKNNHGRSFFLEDSYIYIRHLQLYA